jgi:23S rRNA (adenine2503-C2)-methyltransferase
MRVADIRQRLADLGAKPGHVERLLRNWTQARPLDDCKPAHAPPLAVRGVLPRLTLELESLARVCSEHPSEDGSVRLLLELADGQTIESVLLGRDGLCVSTQVGCAVG